MRLFDRFFYGNAGKRDYSEADMPSNRFALFFQTWRDHVFDLIRVNLMQLPFWIPAFVWSYLNLLMLFETASDAQLLQERLPNLAFAWLLGMIPCILITGPSSAGSARIMRNWARDEHAFIFSDFRDAFRENWKQALGVSVLSAVVPVILAVSFAYYLQQSRVTAIVYVPIAVTACAAFVWLLMLPLFYPLIVGFRLRFGEILRNAFLLSIAELPVLLLVRLVSAVPVLLFAAAVFMGWVPLMIGAAVYYLLYGLAFSRMLYAAAANGIFDRRIHPLIEGANVRTGLRPKEEEEQD